MAGKNGVDQLRNDRVVVADDPREQPIATLQLSDEVIADLLLDGPRRDASSLAQFSERVDGSHHEWILSELQLD